MTSEVTETTSMDTAAGAEVAEPPGPSLDEFKLREVQVRRPARGGRV